MTKPAIVLLVLAAMMVAFAGGICLGAKIINAKHQAGAFHG